jgi:hypothetical protein
MADPKPDPLSPLPDPWKVPADYPVFTDPTPTPADPVIPEGRAACPHCATVFRSTNRLQKDGDFGVCHSCSSTLIYETDRWRQVTFDEALEAEADPRVQVLKTFRPPIPET